MSMRIQLRRGTSNQWITANPILAEGEMGFEIDTSKIKIGNGLKIWTQLDYFAGSGAAIPIHAGTALIYDSTTNTLSLDQQAVVLDGENF